MDSKSIYQLLQTKKHNQHHLQRYWKFVQICRCHPDEYVEKHHILPKAKDLFPEYADWKEHPWNMVELTARQHIIAHVMLWKAYGGSQSLALDCMLGNFNSETNNWLSKRIVPQSIKIRYLAKSREDSCKFKSEIRIGKAPFRDAAGNNYFLETNDPLIAELGLVGYLEGYKMTDDSKEKMRRSKDHSRKIALWKQNTKKTVVINSTEYIALVAEGWTTDRTEESYLIGREQQKKKVSERFKGTFFYCNPDGSLFGRIAHDDPRIIELGLTKKEASDSQRATTRDASARASAARKGTKIWNNGIVNKRFKECPGEGWVLGSLSRGTGWDRNQRKATSAAIKGSTTWNDGKRNYRLKPGMVPEAGWVKGMVPRKKK